MLVPVFRRVPLILPQLKLAACGEAAQIALRLAGMMRYPDLLESIEDVGYPFSPEKVLSLAPDLIIFDDWDETGIEALSQIAPTVVVGLDSTFPTEERVRQLAELFGRTEQADAWFNAYKAKVEAD